MSDAPTPNDEHDEQTPDEIIATGIVDGLDEAMAEHGIELPPHVAERLFDEIVALLEQRTNGSGES